VFHIHVHGISVNFGQPGTLTEHPRHEGSSQEGEGPERQFRGRFGRHPRALRFMPCASLLVSSALVTELLFSFTRPSPLACCACCFLASWRR